MSTEITTASIAAATFTLTKLVSKPLEVMGEILADRAQFWRLQNQISILKQAQEYARANGIEIKPIHLKTLLPLLDGASLEEDPTIQKLWARLLANAGQIDVPQSIANITVELLKSISTQDAKVLIAIFESTFIKFKEIELQQAATFKVHPNLKHYYSFDPHVSIAPSRIMGMTGLDISALQLSTDNLARFEIIRHISGGDLKGIFDTEYGQFSFTKLGWQVVCLIQGFQPPNEVEPKT